MVKQVAQLNAEIDAVRKEGDVVRGELDELKFHMHGITDTYRRDQIFKKLASDVKEVEAIFEDCEKEREKQQEAIFGVMDYINVGGGMLPK
jgi:hypothetical protein